jgi:hypothetical protein
MKAIITTLLLLGTSTAALAQPVNVDRTYPGYNDLDRHDDGRYENRYDGRFDNRDDAFQHRMWFRKPVLLASNVSMMRQWNRDQRPMLIDLDQRAGNLRRLRIDRNEGRMFVDTVVINYTDGHQQTVQLRQPLSFRDPSITIDLDHGGATSMYIYGSTMRGRATFDVVGLRR